MAFFGRKPKPHIFTPDDQAVIDSFVQTFPAPAGAFSDEQYQLQSLIESGMVHDSDVEFAKRLAYAVSPSHKQTIWITTILNKILNNSIQYDFANIFRILDAAPKKFYYFYNGYPLKLSVATASSKYPGAISIVTEEPQSLGYLGRIDKNMSVYIVKDAADQQEDIIKLLMDMNKDTMRTITTHAILSNMCCFCQRPLTIGTDDTRLGYDSTCAMAYNIPHTTKVVPASMSPSVKDIIDATEALTGQPIETLAQKMARGPFDPAIMNAILQENPGRRR